MNLKLSLAGVTATALLLTALTAAPARADEDPGTDPPSTSETPEEVVESGLADEGLTTTEIDLDTDGIELAAESTDPTDPFAFTLDLVDGQPTGTYTVTDLVDGQVTTTTFDVAIQTSTIERAVFDLTNPTTGETYHYDSNEGATSVAFIIPIAFGAISLATALYYLATGAAIVLLGVLALEAAKAVSKIVAENDRQSSSKKRDYYPAERSGSKVYISPSGLTKSQALSRGRAADDVWAISQTSAKALCKDLNPSGTPIGKEKHGVGYLWHFHPYKHVPNMHCFFGGPA